MYAIGIDLAWKPTNASGLCIVDRQMGVQYLDTGIYSNDDIWQICRPYITSETVITIDAPLHVPNENGIRSCELAFKRQSIRGAKISILGSNRHFLLNHFGQIRGEELVRLFMENCDTNNLEIPQIKETFPTASVQGLFGKRILYKIAKAKSKSNMIIGLKELMAEFSHDDFFIKVIDQAEIIAMITADPLPTLRALKLLEDKIDGAICAQTAYQIMMKKVNGYAEIIGDKNDGSLVFSLKVDK